ncbi:MAG: hypothetical protein J6O40_02475 [Ruminococcus sp.]|nr:hypothetical protein [Ruminococcus sp.]
MELKKPMKYSIILGLIGSALIPVLYEVYANIGKTFAIILLFVWTGVCIYKLMRFPTKEAMLAITCLIAYTGIFGIVMYVIIHPAVQSFLEKSSKYYYLTLKEEMYFFGFAIGVMLLLYLMFFFRLFMIKGIARLKEISEKSGEYIENAFDSSEDGEDL